MTLSIEVLPAPFGPMMARTSPFLMSKETSRIARTPPNDSDTPSIESRTSPAAMSLSAGALMAWPFRLSFRDRAQRGTRNPGTSIERASGFRVRSLRSRPGMTERVSCRLLHCRRHRYCRHVPDLHPRRDRALAAVLERHLGRNVGLAG